jgi:flagellar protein FlaJ
MLSLKKLNNIEYENKQKKKIERELPYFVTIVTLLATSGLGPYFIFQKIREFNLLPTIRAESEKILKRIDLLGIDPLTAMSQAKDRPSSKALGEFLSGYVSSIQSGGNVINYLKSKMNSIFDRYAEVEKQSISKVQALIEAYMTIQVVVLALYIMVTSMGPSLNMGMSAPSSSSFKPDYIMLILSPVVSAGFLFISRSISHSKVNEIEIKQILKFAIPSFGIVVVLMITGILSNLVSNGYLLAGAFIASSIWPALKFKKIYTASLDAESATPQILRDITEARKAGIGPEKCVIHACKRSDYKLFNPIAKAIATKLEWGIPLQNIFETIEKEIKNFQVLINFRILIEVISSGGGSVQTLDALADTSEKFHNVDKNKRDMLKPYVMVGFMLIGITSFTTLIVIDSFGNINQMSEVNKEKLAQLEKNSQSTLELFSIAIVIQAWLAGLFLGKITTGSFSGGFINSILLIIISLVGIIMVQYSIIDLNSLF